MSKGQVSKDLYTKVGTCPVGGRKHWHIMIMSYEASLCSMLWRYFYPDLALYKHSPFTFCSSNTVLLIVLVILISLGSPTHIIFSALNTLSLYPPPSQNFYFFLQDSVQVSLLPPTTAHFLFLKVSLDSLASLKVETKVFHTFIPSTMPATEWCLICWMIEGGNEINE